MVQGRLLFRAHNLPNYYIVWDSLSLFVYYSFIAKLYSIYLMQRQGEGGSGLFLSLFLGFISSSFNWPLFLAPPASGLRSKKLLYGSWDHLCDWCLSSDFFVFGSTFVDVIWCKRYLFLAGFFSYDSPWLPSVFPTQILPCLGTSFLSMTLLKGIHFSLGKTWLLFSGPFNPLRILWCPPPF